MKIMQKKKRLLNENNAKDKLLVSKFNLQKADLIRLGQVWLLLFLLHSLFIYFNLGP